MLVFIQFVYLFWFVDCLVCLLMIMYGLDACDLFVSLIDGLLLYWFLYLLWGVCYTGGDFLFVTLFCF